MKHVLIAPDKFKGSLTATEVTEAMTAGLRQVTPDIPVRALPMADGGEGTVDAAIAAGFTRITGQALGPTGQEVSASIAIRADTAVVELAEAAGLQRLPHARAAPLTASSFGVGHLIRAAVSAGARRVVLGVGGSACTDGGAGMITALGGRLLDAEGNDLPPGGAALRDLATVDLSKVDLAVDFELACDVDNPLLGPHGAAAVYGPQKGAGPGDIAVLEEGMRRWADVVERQVGSRFADQPGAGAAGGVGFAALAVLGARMRPGIDLLMDLLGFDEALRGARLVITGEGSLDEQTLRGKTPAGIAAAAKKSGVPVIVVAGRCLLTEKQVKATGFDAVYALTDIEPDTARCVAEARKLVHRIAARIAVDWRAP